MCELVGMSRFPSFIKADCSFLDKKGEGIKKNDNGKSFLNFSHCSTKCLWLFSFFLSFLFCFQIRCVHKRFPFSKRNISTVNLLCMQQQFSPRLNTIFVSIVSCKLYIARKTWTREHDARNETFFLFQNQKKFLSSNHTIALPTLAKNVTVWSINRWIEKFFHYHFFCSSTQREKIAKTWKKKKKVCGPVSFLYCFASRFFLLLPQSACMHIE